MASLSPLAQQQLALSTGGQGSPQYADVLDALQNGTLQLPSTAGPQNVGSAELISPGAPVSNSSGSTYAGMQGYGTLLPTGSALQNAGGLTTTSPYGSGAGGGGGTTVPTNATTTDASGSVTTALTPNAQLPVSQYTQAVESALNPTFQQQNQSLTEQLEGEGILNSGAASNQLQNLTAQQGATVSSDVAPLIEQGYSEQNANNQQNASAENSMLQNQMGLSNEDYENLLQDVFGLSSSGQNAENAITTNLVPTGSNAYQAGQNLAASYMGEAGAGSVGSPSTTTNNQSDPYLGTDLGALAPSGTSYDAGTGTYTSTDYDPDTGGGTAPGAIDETTADYSG